MQLFLDAHRLPQSLAKSASFFTSDKYHSEKKTSLSLKQKHGQGEVRAIAFDGDIAFIQLSMKLKEPMDLLLDYKDNNLLCFSFCLQGKFSFKTEGAHSAEILVTPLDSCINSKTAAQPIHFIFPAAREVKCVMVIVDRVKLMKKAEAEMDALPASLQPFFLQDHDHPGFFRQLGKNSEIARITNEIFTSDGNMLSEYLALEAAVLQLVAWQMKQLEAEENGQNNQRNMIRYDWERIMEARDELVHDIRNPPTIKELSRKVGINENKLKKGFKKVFYITLYQYLIIARFKLAKELLEEGRLNISQIAERVGYNNKSHFSNKFKRIYGVLPKDFVKGVQAEKRDNGHFITIGPGG
ncbi:MAG: AraC family transcriptional regulator [Bacteroidia bacterium]